MNVNVSLRADDLTTPVEVAEARLATGETQVRLGAGYSLYAYVTAEGARAVAAAWSDLAVRLAAGDGSGWVAEPDTPVVVQCGALSASDPEDSWSCTLDEGHEGPHEARGSVSSTPYAMWTGDFIVFAAERAS